MNNAFPIDYDALKKGESRISQETIEKVYQVKLSLDPQEYAFAKLKLRDQIILNRPDLAAHVKSSGPDIEILTDEQAEEHTRREFDRHRRGILVTTARRAAIDRSRFSTTQLAAAESQDRLQQVSALDLRRRQEEANRKQLFAAPAVKELVSSK